MSDACEGDRQHPPYACLTVTTPAGVPVTFYVDAGRHDGASGSWQETNGVKGLQKEATYVGHELDPADQDVA